MKKEKLIEILEMIKKDVENDAENFDGRPFNGRTIGEYFGYHGAAIASLADVIKSILGKDWEKL